MKHPSTVTISIRERMLRLYTTLVVIEAHSAYVESSESVRRLMVSTYEINRGFHLSAVRSGASADSEALLMDAIANVRTLLTTLGEVSELLSEADQVVSQQSIGELTAAALAVADRTLGHRNAS